MYVPKHFRMDDLETAKAFISSNEFATVVSVGNGVPLASHLLTELRVEANGEAALYSHMAKNNPQWKSFDPGTEVLAIFQGSHTYISPTWYRENPAVPTWNYLAVHAYGYPRIIDDRSELYGLLERLVEREEKGNDPDSAYRLRDLDPFFVESMMKGVVGVRIAISRMEAAFKLSQNRRSEDYERIIIELKKRSDEDSHSVARAMERYRPEGETPGTQAR